MNKELEETLNSKIRRILTNATDASTEDDLLEVIESLTNMATYKMQKIVKCRRDLGDIEDLRQEFRVNVLSFIKQVKLHIGSPMYFLLDRSFKRVQDIVRNRKIVTTVSYYELNEEDADLIFEDDNDTHLDYLFFIETLDGQMREVASLLITTLRDENNYMQKIGDRLGISKQRVHFYTKKIRDAYRRFIS